MVNIWPLRGLFNFLRGLDPPPPDRPVLAENRPATCVARADPRLTAIMTTCDSSSSLVLSQQSQANSQPHSAINIRILSPPSQRIPRATPTS
jgi:hypothetical protein